MNNYQTILKYFDNHSTNLRRVIQCESKGVQSAVQRRLGYTVLYLQTCKDLCIVQGTAAGEYASQLLKAS